MSLFKALEPEITALQEARNEPLKPRVHADITDLASFVETFLHFFQIGSNAEFVSKDKALFFLLLDRLRDKGLATNDEIGGHSSVWAIRAQYENCKVYVVPDN